MAQLEAIERALEQFVVGLSPLCRETADFNRDVDLFGEGFLDSADAVELLAFLEQRYAVSLSEDELFGPHFSSIRGIAGLIQQHLG